MHNLAKTFSIRTLMLHVAFIAVVAVSIAGLSRQSPLLMWTGLVATVLLVVVADPLTSPNKAGVVSTVEGREDSAIKRKPVMPNNRVQVTSVSKAMIAS